MTDKRSNSGSTMNMRVGTGSRVAAHDLGGTGDLFSLQVHIRASGDAAYVENTINFLADSIQELRDLTYEMRRVLIDLEAEVRVAGLTVDAPEFTVPDEITAMFPDRTFVPVAFSDAEGGDYVVDGDGDVCRMLDEFATTSGRRRAKVLPGGVRYAPTIHDVPDKSAWREVPASPADLS